MNFALFGGLDRRPARELVAANLAGQQQLLQSPGPGSIYRSLLLGFLVRFPMFRKHPVQISYLFSRGIFRDSPLIHFFPRIGVHNYSNVINIEQYNYGANGTIVSAVIIKRY